MIAVLKKRKHDICRVRKSYKYCYDNFKPNEIVIIDKMTMSINKQMQTAKFNLLDKKLCLFFTYNTIKFTMHDITANKPK